jgi:hypothetical protein
VPYPANAAPLKNKKVADSIMVVLELEAITAFLSLAAWLQGEHQDGEWLAKSVLASFSDFFAPRSRGVANLPADDLEVTAWKSATDRCPPQPGCMIPSADEGICFASQLRLIHFHWFSQYKCQSALAVPLDMEKWLTPN